MATYIDYDEYGVNLTEAFRKGVERIIEFRLKHSKASQDLQNRIVDTICLRQQHFSYLRSRRAKNASLNRSINEPRPVIKSSLGTTFSVTGSVSPSEAKENPKKKLRAPQGNQSILTATTAQPDRITKAYSIQSADDIQDPDIVYSDADLPPPPKGLDHLKEFECPYCFLVCSTEEVSGERWK